MLWISAFGSEEISWSLIIESCNKSSYSLDNVMLKAYVYISHCLKFEQFWSSNEEYVSDVYVYFILTKVTS